LNPWAAATRHPWRGAANPASCRVTHEFKPAFGQRGLTGRLRSKAEQDQDQERLASHRGYRWVADLRSLSIEPPPSQASQLPLLDLCTSINFLQPQTFPVPQRSTSFKHLDPGDSPK
ncbi:hypothetical protein U3E46_26810, partial [Pseudomonas paracarnis]